MFDLTRDGVEDTTFKAKAKDSKKIRGLGQGPIFRGHTLSRPKTEMVEAKDRGLNFSELRWVNFPKFLSAKVLKILHFVKFLMKI